MSTVSVLDEVRERSDIVDVVSGYVALEPADLVGL